jgi:hypothetical protein
MDAKQPNITQAFGFVHALLRNGSFIYRLIEPPEQKISTNYSLNGAVYHGGPVLMMPGSSIVIGSVLPAFPMAILHTLKHEFTSDRVFIVKEPTKILWMNGLCGRTDRLLREMKIPFTPCTDKMLKSNPDMVWGYTLLIDDCYGMFGVPEKLARMLRNFTVRGNEIIFTCWALTDMEQTFANYVKGDITTSVYTRNSDIAELPDFPAQYDGRPTVTFKGIWTKAYPGLPNVSVIAKGAQWSDAIYFYYGRGVAEFFSFHPGEQTGDAKRAAITLYGNKLIHYTASNDNSVVSAQTKASQEKIATRGTSNNRSEQCAITIEVTPQGFNVTPVSQLTVNFRLLPHIDNVSGSFFNDAGLPLPPDSITVNADLSKSLRWGIGNLGAGKDWRVLFNVTSAVNGTCVLLNDPLASNITYIDDGAVPRTAMFLQLAVDVADGYTVTEPGLIPAVVLVGFLIIYATVAEKRKPMNPAFASFRRNPRGK